MIFVRFHICKSELDNNLSVKSRLELKDTTPSLKLKSILEAKSVLLKDIDIEHHKIHSTPLESILLF